jgi:methanogenic corrinoid protein MtbC1
MRRLLSDFPDDPIYNMKAVEQQTGISAATLRAWERRYSLVEPKRTASGYRLYSDRDVALLRWVRNQMTEGLTISRVVAMLLAMRQHTEPIWIDSEDAAVTPQQEAPVPPPSFVQPLYQALAALDADRADEIMEQAFALYTMTTVYVEIIVPALVEIGEAWHRGEITIATEHFASAYLRGRLMGLFQAYPNHHDMPMIMVGCAPGERHEIGALIFALMLRQHGYNVIFLGQDVPVGDMIETVMHERPAMLCLSASSPASARALTELVSGLSPLGLSAPLVCYGGRAFDQDADLRQEIQGHYLGSDPRDAIGAVANLLSARNGYSA